MLFDDDNLDEATSELQIPLPSFDGTQISNHYRRKIPLKYE